MSFWLTSSIDRSSYVFEAGAIACYERNSRTLTKANPQGSRGAGASQSTSVVHSALLPMALRIGGCQLSGNSS